MGERILVLEDDYWIAQELSRMLEGWGFEVLGPAATVDEGFSIMASGAVDRAVLDIDLDGEKVFALADQLEERGVPIIFATGYDASVLPPRYRSKPHFEKPIDPVRMKRVLQVPEG